MKQHSSDILISKVYILFCYLRCLMFSVFLFNVVQGLLVFKEV